MRKIYLNSWPPIAQATDSAAGWQRHGTSTNADVTWHRSASQANVCAPDVYLWFAVLYALGLGHLARQNLMELKLDKSSNLPKTKMWLNGSNNEDKSDRAWANVFWQDKCAFWSYLPITECFPLNCGEQYTQLKKQRPITSNAPMVSSIRLCVA